MKVLVTGASGFVGTHLVHALAAAGMIVRAAGRRPGLAQDGAEFVALEDVRSADWPALVAGVDAVVHLAALAHTRGVDERLIRAINHDPVVALCHALHPGQRLVFVSSIRAMAGPGASSEITEAAAPTPACAYGRCKLESETAVRECAPRAAILRPTTIYGAGAKHNVARLAALARLPLPLPVANFDAPRSFVSVQNVCSAIIHVLRGERSSAFNVSDPDAASLRDLVCWLREAAGAPCWSFRLPATLAAFARRLPAFENLSRFASESLVARPERLLATGWRPVHASSREGVHRWARDFGSAIPA